MEHEKTLVSVKSAAKMAQIPEYALRRWIQSGQVPTIKSGRRVYIPLNKLEEFLNGD